MNEEFMQEFYRSVCFAFRKEDDHGKEQNRVCFAAVDESGRYVVCLNREDSDAAIFYRCYHRVLMQKFGIPAFGGDEEPGECFSLKQLEEDLEAMKRLDPIETARMGADGVPDCIRRVAAIAEYEDAAVTEDFLPVGRACAELVFGWKKAIADRYFHGLLMADAALIAVFFKLAYIYANAE